MPKPKSKIVDMHGKRYEYTPGPHGSLIERRLADPTTTPKLMQDNRNTKRARTIHIPRTGTGAVRG